MTRVELGFLAALLLVSCVVQGGVAIEDQMMEWIEDFVLEEEETRLGRSLFQDYTPVYDLPDSAPDLPSYFNLKDQAAPAPQDTTLPTGVSSATGQPTVNYGALPPAPGDEEEKPEQYKIEQVMVALLNQISKGVQYMYHGLDYIIKGQQFNDTDVTQLLQQSRRNLKEALVNIVLNSRTSYPERYVGFNGTQFWESDTMPTLKSPDTGCKNGGYRRRLLIDNSASFVLPNELYIERCMPGSAAARFELATLIGLFSIAKGVTFANNATRRMIIMSGPDFGYNLVAESVDNAAAANLQIISDQASALVKLFARLFYGYSGRKLMELPTSDSGAVDPSAVPEGTASIDLAPTDDLLASGVATGVEAPTDSSTSDDSSTSALCTETPWMLVESPDVVPLVKCDWDPLWNNIQAEVKSFADLMSSLKQTIDSLWGSITCNALKETQGRVLEQLRSSYPMKPCTTMGCNLCVMPRLGAKDVGTDIVEAGCLIDAEGDRRSQQWEFMYANSEQPDTYQIRSLSANKCINAPRGVTKTGYVELGACSEEGTKSNMFRVIQLDVVGLFPDERFILVHLDSKLCMGVKDTSGRFLLMDCNCAVTQIFKGMDRY